VFADTASGSLRTRLELDKCPDYLRAGDTLVAWKLDRLGRSHRHLLDTVAALGERRIAFGSLRDPIDTSTAAGKLVFNLFAALAEFDLNAEFGIKVVVPRRRLCQVGPPRRVFCLRRGWLGVAAFRHNLRGRVEVSCCPSGRTYNSRR
jgi:hypothetical protein